MQRRSLTSGGKASFQADGAEAEIALTQRLISGTRDMG